MVGLSALPSGLDLLLNLKHHTFPPVLANKGARVQVHQPDEEPEVEDSGMNVMPHTATSIAIEKASKAHNSVAQTVWSDKEQAR